MHFPHVVCIFSEREGLNPQASLSPDDDVFKHLASTYANNHLTMHKGRPCKDDAQGFPGGITNGAAWYSVTGDFFFFFSYVHLI